MTPNRLSHSPICATDVLTTRLVAGTLPTMDRRPKVAACFGGGGAFGIGFNLGVARALMEAGIPITAGPMLGTSAGAWTAAALAVGVGLADIEATWRNTPQPGTTRVIELTRLRFGDIRDSRVSTMAIRLPIPYPVVLSGDDHDLADQVAASSSPPRLAVPHRIGRHRYVDAGVVTSTSADRARFGRPARRRRSHGWARPRPVRRVHGTGRRLRDDALADGWWTGAVRAPEPRRRRPGRHAGGRPAQSERARPTYLAAYELGQRCADRFWTKHEPLARRLAV